MFIHVPVAEHNTIVTHGMVTQMREACGDPSWVCDVEWEEGEELAFSVSLVGIWLERMQGDVFFHVFLMCSHMVLIPTWPVCVSRGQTR